MEDFNVLSLASHIDYQAVVAVFNGAVDTLDTMQRVWDSIEDHKSEFEIKLAVLLCLDRDKYAHPPVLEKANAVFAERSTELIVVEDFGRVGASRTTVTEEGYDYEGIDRVRDALQAHVWPGMQRKRAETERLNGASGHEMVTALEPSIAALLQENFSQEDNLEDNDEADKLFGEVLDFRQKMGGASRRQRADAAAEIVMRMHVLMGENSEDSSIDDSEEVEDDEDTSPTNQH